MPETPPPPPPPRPVKPLLTSESIGLVLDEIWVALEERLNEKGSEPYVSTHETFGIVHEEYRELDDTLRGNDLNRFHEELVDLGVACVLGLASMISWAEPEEMDLSNLELPHQVVKRIGRGVDLRVHLARKGRAVALCGADVNSFRTLDAPISCEQCNAIAVDKFQGVRRVRR